MPSRFHAHFRGDDRHRSQPVPQAADAIEAALLFLESRHPEAEGPVSVIVEDCETGCDQCFTVDLEGGGVTSC